jgi:excisionase family DNA binding protein
VVAHLGMEIAMSTATLSRNQARPMNGTRTITPDGDDIPLTVRQAATYLGVSVQTVYLWVERKQIPHLRVMGRNIRFLKSDLEPFRATFKQEVGYGKT